VEKKILEKSPDNTWIGCQDCDVSFACHDGEACCIRNNAQPVRVPSFPVGAVILHVKSGNKYRVLEAPYTIRIESTNEPAYLYQSLTDYIKWVRSQTIMEDGRFRLLSIVE